MRVAPLAAPGSAASRFQAQLAWPVAAAPHWFWNCPGIMRSAGRMSCSGGTTISFSAAAVAAADADVAGVAVALAARALGLADAFAEVSDALPPPEEHAASMPTATRTRRGARIDPPCRLPRGGTVGCPI